MFRGAVFIRTRCISNWSYYTALRDDRDDDDDALVAVGHLWSLTFNPLSDQLCDPSVNMATFTRLLKSRFGCQPVMSLSSALNAKSWHLYCSVKFLLLRSH